MEFKELVNIRRSIRKFESGAEIDKSVVTDIIKTALCAPSWKNTETGKYFAVTTPDILSEVREKCLPEFNQKNCAGASALIVTAFEKSLSGFDSDKNPVNELGDEWGAYDLGLQNQLLILAAREHGYDTLIMGIRSGTALREILSIPDSLEVVSVIALGKRGIDPAAPKRREVEEVLKFY